MRVLDDWIFFGGLAGSMYKSSAARSALTMFAYFALCGRLLLVDGRLLPTSCCCCCRELCTGVAPRLGLLRNELSGRLAAVLGGARGTTLLLPAQDAVAVVVVAFGCDNLAAVAFGGDNVAAHALGGEAEAFGGKLALTTALGGEVRCGCVG